MQITPKKQTIVLGSSWQFIVECLINFQKIQCDTHFSNFLKYLVNIGYWDFKKKIINKDWVLIS